MQGPFVIVFLHLLSNALNQVSTKAIVKKESTINTQAIESNRNLSLGRV